MVQFANFTGYFCMAVPSGLPVKRDGYKGGILIGLVLIALGALWFIPLADHLPSGWTYLKDGAYFITAFGSTRLGSYGGLGLFLTGRLLGSALLRVFSAHVVLAVFAAANAVACLLVFMNLGWISVGALFAVFFLMSIMFPTIFALDIHGSSAARRRT